MLEKCTSVGETCTSNDKPFRTVKIIHIRIVRGSTATQAKPASTTVKKPASAPPAAPANPN